MNAPLRITIALLAFIAVTVPCAAFAQAGLTPAASSAVSTASPLAAQPGGVITPAAPASYGAPAVPEAGAAAGAAVATPVTGSPQPATSPVSAASGVPAVLEELPEVPWFWLGFTIVVVALLTAYIVNARTEKRPPL
jgi:hypothetical protein